MSHNTSLKQDRTSRPAASVPLETVQSVSQELWNQGLFDPLNSFLRRPGKRIRAELVEWSYRLAGGTGSVPAELQKFIELIHAGSLVVDDIEDGSEFRRGEPALHRQYGLPIALNAANWMYFSAFENLTGLAVSEVRQARILRLAITTIRRCHEGQAIDLAAKVDELDASQIEPTANQITQLKTAGLTALAAGLGAMLAGASSEVCGTHSAFAAHLGVALQMQNDLAELSTLARHQGRSDDMQNARVTWPWAWASRLQSGEVFRRWQAELGHRERPLPDIANEILLTVESTGKQQIGRQLKLGMEIVQRDLGERAAQEAGMMLATMEKRYA